MSVRAIAELVSETCEDQALFGADGACPVLHEPGDQASRVVVITGENAEGKSLFCRYLRMLLRDETEPKIEVIDTSMQRRSSGGFERAFLYGDESWESTGQISLKFMLGAIRTCKGRENPHALVLDEPDIGLSEGYSAALGALLLRFTNEMPEKTTALVIVTHSRPIVESLLEAKPHFIRVGTDLRPTLDWLRDGPLPRSIEDIETLGSRSVERFRAVTAIMKQRKSQ